MAATSYKDLASSIMDRARRLGATFADLRVTRSENTRAQVQDRRADRLALDVAQGVGLRVLVDEAWGFAGTDDLRPKTLEEALDKAVSMARASSSHVLNKGSVATVKPLEAVERVQGKIDPRSVPIREKMDRLLALEKAALDDSGSAIVNSLLVYNDGVSSELLLNTSGTCIEK